MEKWFRIKDATPPQTLISYWLSHPNYLIRQAFAASAPWIDIKLARKIYEKGLVP